MHTGGTQQCMYACYRVTGMRLLPRRRISSADDHCSGRKSPRFRLDKQMDVFFTTIGLFRFERYDQTQSRLKIAFFIFLFL